MLEQRQNAQRSSSASHKPTVYRMRRAARDVTSRLLCRDYLASRNSVKHFAQESRTVLVARHRQSNFSVVSLFIESATVSSDSL